MSNVTAENDLIEQIVANVLAELQPAPKVREATAAPLAGSQPATAILDFDAPVITADLLAERVRHERSVRIGHRSILTPSARDWLAQRKMSWTQMPGSAAAQSQTSGRWQLLVTTATPAVAALQQSLSGWTTELLGTPQEAAEQAIRAICTGEADGVLALCHAAETVACLANRNSRLRAAVLHSAAGLPELVSQLDPNLIVINPRQKSFVELRNITRAVGALSKPRGHAPWVSGN